MSAFKNAAQAQKSLKISFATPHQNERPCVDQVQKRLFPILETSVSLIPLKAENIMDRCVAVRKGMPYEQKALDDFPDYFHALIKTYDFVTRISYAYTGLIENKADLHVEMHAMNMSCLRSLPDNQEWGNISNTSIYYYKKKAAIFQLKKRPRLSENTLMNEIVRFFGVDIQDAVKEAYSKLHALFPLRRRILEIEVPGKEEKILPDHPAYDCFANISIDIHVKDSPLRKKREYLTWYESSYCKYSYSSINIADTKITRVAEFLVNKASDVSNVKV